MNYALHIGINRYVRYAANGSSNLRGAVNDAHRWRKYTRHDLGVPDARARVLIDGAATRQGILDALVWLREQVGADGRGSGLITYSGHGTAMDATGGANIGRTAALCPSDVAIEGDELVHPISLSELEDVLGPAAANTTIVLDACYTRVPNPARPSRALGTGAAPDVHDRVESRLILGCEPWGQSYEMRSGGNWHGAMTFSMLTLLEQWTVKRSAGVVYANVSYGDLVYRTHEQLGVLGVEQTPILLGEPRSALIPFLRPGREIAAGSTSPVPDVRRPGSQLGAGDGSTGYRIYSLSAHLSTAPPPSQVVAVLATVLVSRETTTQQCANGVNYVFTKDYEYWWPASVQPSAVFPNNGNNLFDSIVVKLQEDRADWSQFPNVPGSNPPIGQDSANYGLNPGGTSPAVRQVSNSYVAEYGAQVGSTIFPPDPVLLASYGIAPASSLGCWAMDASAVPGDSATAVWPTMTPPNGQGNVQLFDIFWFGPASAYPDFGKFGFFGSMSAGDSITYANNLGNDPENDGDTYGNLLTWWTYNQYND